MVEYSKVLQDAKAIEGWMLDESIAVWHFLLSSKPESEGGMLEIGVLHGKSASILANHAAENNEPLYLVDPELTSGARNSIGRIHPSTRFIECFSEALPSNQLMTDAARSLRFIHVDGMHRFANVLEDLRIAQDLLSDFGIVSVDDFFTDLFPQVAAAVFQYVTSAESKLSIFLTAFNKCYLCKKSAKLHYLRLVRFDALERLRAMGHVLTLVKTDKHENFNAFSLVPDTWGSEARHQYGNPDEF